MQNAFSNKTFHFITKAKYLREAACKGKRLIGITMSEFHNPRVGKSTQLTRLEGGSGRLRDHYMAIQEAKRMAGPHLASITNPLVKMNWGPPIMTGISLYAFGTISSGLWILISIRVWKPYHIQIMSNSKLHHKGLSPKALLLNSSGRNGHFGLTFIILMWHQGLWFSPFFACAFLSILVLFLLFITPRLQYG